MGRNERRRTRPHSGTPLHADRRPCHEEIAQVEARATGKPLKQARADASGIARYFEFDAGAADKLHDETLPYQTGFTVMTIREPHGVTEDIVPWNYPLQIFGRSAGAALSTGNACAAEAGLPEGALNIVTSYRHEAGTARARHPGIDHISFIGSPATGAAVTKMAADNHIPVTLELGGKSSQIVFADADFAASLPVLVAAIVQNAGQTCSAGSRVLIERSAYAASGPARAGVRRAESRPEPARFGLRTANQREAAAGVGFPFRCAARWHRNGRARRSGRTGARS